MKSIPLVIAFTVLGFGASVCGAADVGENWTEYCKRCHGADGAAKTKLGRKLKLRDYRDAAVQADMSDQEIIDVIIEGVTTKRGKEAMPDYAEKLTQEEIEAFIPYIRALETP